MEHRPSLLRALALAGALASACSSNNPPPPPGDGGPVDAGATDVAVADVAGDRGPAPVDTGAPDAGAGRCGQFPTCNVVTNTGCGANQGCYRVRGDGGVSAQCVPAGRAGWGEPCEFANSCREGFICLGNPGQCMKLCCGNENSTCRDEARGGRPGAICSGMISDTELRFCLDPQSCDPYATSNNRCPTAAPRCDVIAADGTTNCRAVRSSPPPGTDGARCCSGDECAPGFLCIGPAGSMCDPRNPTDTCRRVCNPAAPDAGVVCPAGQRCAPLNGAPDNYGSCTPPMM